MADPSHPVARGTFVPIRRRCGRVPRAGVLLCLRWAIRRPGSDLAPQSTGYLPRNTFRCTLAADDDRLAGSGPRRAHRRHRGRDRPARPGPRPVDPRPVRDGPLPPRARRLGRQRRQADAPAARPARLRLDRRRPRGGPCPAPRRSSSATTSASSTTTSRTATASAAIDRRCGRSRRPAGDQRRRHAVQPVADRAPSPDRPRLLRRQGPAPDAPVRRDVPGAVRGPVHRHRDERVGRGHVGRRATST